MIKEIINTDVLCMSHLYLVKSLVISGTSFKTDATAIPEVLN